jgi:DNA-binding NarL/FixJ family response regulator
MLTMWLFMSEVKTSTVILVSPFVAMELNVSTYGKRMRNARDSQKEKIHQLSALGKTQQEIARELGISQPKVSRLLRQN